MGVNLDIRVEIVDVRVCLIFSENYSYKFFLVFLRTGLFVGKGRLMLCVSPCLLWLRILRNECSFWHFRTLLILFCSWSVGHVDSFLFCSQSNNLMNDKTRLLRVHFSDDVVRRFIVQYFKHFRSHPTLTIMLMLPRFDRGSHAACTWRHCVNDD